MTLKSKHIKRIVMAKGNVTWWTESDSYTAIETAEKGEDLYGPFDDVSETAKGYKNMKVCYI